MILAQRSGWWIWRLAVDAEVSHCFRGSRRKRLSAHGYPRRKRHRRVRIDTGRAMRCSLPRWLSAKVRFDVQSTFGANLPAGDTARLGRQLLWNTAFQYEAAWKLWPELEVNSTLHRTGPHAGDKQVFLTPGFGFGRVHVGARFRFSSAAGIEIAATRFHSYNHRWIFSERLSF